MQRQWLLPVAVLFGAIVAATATSIYIIHADLSTLSREVTSLRERVAALEQEQVLRETAGGVAAEAPPRVRLAPAGLPLVGVDLARELNLSDEQRREINRRIGDFFVREAAHLAPTTRTAASRMEMTIRTDVQYRSEREARWKQFLADEIGPRLGREQMDRLRERLPLTTVATTETIEIVRW